MPLLRSLLQLLLINQVLPPQLTKRIEIILRRKKHLESLDLSSQIRRVDEEV